MSDGSGSGVVIPSREAVVAKLVENGARVDLATIYADSYLEYQTASANIAEFGLIIKHPRTGNPIVNPYLAIRDGAERKLRNMQNINTDGLW